MSKRLVLIGEGHGEVNALPVLLRKVLEERCGPEELFVDAEMVRARNPSGLIRLRTAHSELDCTEWLRFVEIARRRSNVGGILAVFDGDASVFPAGSKDPFCASSAAQTMARVAAEYAGAGRTFSLAVVFAVKEFESWLIAGAESFQGKRYPEENIPILKNTVRFPLQTNPESQGKRWFETNCTQYRPTRHQHVLAGTVELATIQAKKLRSFRRLENAVNQLLDAVRTGVCVCTPGSEVA